MSIQPTTLLGCKICKKPLEPYERIRLDRHTRHKSLSSKAKTPLDNRHLPSDFHTVAPNCGHIFHRGCIKRLINETASGKLKCPICSKPFVFAQLRPIRFYFPNTTLQTMNLRTKIARLNLENKELNKKLAEAKILRIDKRETLALLQAQVDKGKKLLEAKEADLQRMNDECLAMTIDGLSIQHLATDVINTRNRILEISSTNSVLLTTLENLVAPLSKIESNHNLKWLKGIHDLFCTKGHDDEFLKLSQLSNTTFHQLIRENAVPTVPSNEVVVDVKASAEKTNAQGDAKATTNEAKLELVKVTDKVTDDKTRKKKRKKEGDGSSGNSKCSPLPPYTNTEYLLMLNKFITKRLKGKTKRGSNDLIRKQSRPMHTRKKPHVTIHVNRRLGRLHRSHIGLRMEMRRKGVKKRDHGGYRRKTRA